MDNILELSEKLNSELQDINSEFNDFLNNDIVEANVYNVFLKSITAYSIDTDTTMEMMTGEDDKQKDYPNSIPVIDEVVDPIKDDQTKNPVVNTNGEV